MRRIEALPGSDLKTALALLDVVQSQKVMDVSRFPSAEHLVSWAKLCPRTIQSGTKNTTGPAGQGNPWLKGAVAPAFARHSGLRSDETLRSAFARHLDTTPTEYRTRFTTTAPDA
ncbi:transposase [Kitasatospora xanthocidica]|uniref:transposase n=1 Tax=Kitasatospora xanthocidica TaxID=83382 RepID=UPI0036EA9424